MLAPDPPEEVQQHHDDADVHNHLLSQADWARAGDCWRPNNHGGRRRSGRPPRRQGVFYEPVVSYHIGSLLSIPLSGIVG